MRLLNTNKLAILVFTLSVIYFFSSIFFGLDFTDSFFHINQALQPVDGVYLSSFVLSSLVITSIVHVFGAELIILRLLNALFLLTAVLLPLILVIRYREFPTFKMLLLISMTIVLISPMNVNILGYDTFSILIISIVFSVIILYLSKPRLYLLLILSVLSALAVLLRLPNIAVVPIIITAIYFRYKWNNCNEVKYNIKPITSLIIYIIATAIIVFLGYFSCYKEINTFMQSLSTPDSHGLKSLINNYIDDGVKLMKYFLFILIVFLLFNKTKFLFEDKKIIHSCIFILIQIFFIIYLILFSPYSRNYSLYLTAIVLVIITVNIYNAYVSADKNAIVVLSLFSLILFVNPFGSNTGFLKASSLLVLLPFICCFLHIKFKNFLGYSLILIIPFAIIEKLHKTYEDDSFTKLESLSQMPLLQFIRTSAERVSMIQSIDDQVMELKRSGVQVYFYGSKSHLFHYLYPNTNLSIRSFYQPIDELHYLPQIENKALAAEHVALFIVDSYPEENTSNDNSPLEREILKRGFEKVENSPIKYYSGSKYILIERKVSLMESIQ